MSKRTIFLVAIIIFLCGCGLMWTQNGVRQSSHTTAPGYPFPNKIWALGGYDDGTGLAYNTVYASSDGGATWATPPGASLPANSLGGGPLVVGNFLYYIGGTDPTGNSNVSNIWVTQDAVTWNTATYALPAINGMALTLLFNGCIFEIGGTNNDEGAGALNTVQKSCDGGITWNNVGALTTPVFGACGTVYNNQMWIIGGAINATATRYDLVYSSSDGVTWTLQGHYPFVLVGCKAVTFNNAIYVAGGAAGAMLTQVYSSTDGNTWNLIGNMPGARANGGLVVYNNNLVYVGGMNSTYFLGAQKTVFSSATGGTGTWTTYNTLPQPRSYLYNAVVY